MQRLFNCYFLWWGSVGAEGEIARVSAKPVTDEQGAACISPSTLCWKDTHLPDWWGALLPATSLPSFSPSPHLLPLSYTYFSLYLPLPFHFPPCHTQKQTYTHCKFTHTHAHTHTHCPLCVCSLVHNLPLALWLLRGRTRQWDSLLTSLAPPPPLHWCLATRFCSPTEQQAGNNTRTDATCYPDCTGQKLTMFMIICLKKNVHFYSFCYRAVFCLCHLGDCGWCDTHYCQWHYIIPLIYRWQLCTKKNNESKLLETLMLTKQVQKIGKWTCLKYDYLTA